MAAGDFVRGTGLSTRVMVATVLDIIIGPVTFSGSLQHRDLRETVGRGQGGRGHPDRARASSRTCPSTARYRTPPPIASVGQAKRPGGPVARRASVFVFPDLDTGNTTYKAVQRSARVVSIGPMLQGLAKPVNDLSRGALVEDIIYTIALTAIQARAT